MTVGLAATASYLPEKWMSAAEISEASSIPEQVILDKFGLRGKHIAAADEHVSGMSVEVSDLPSGPEMRFNGTVEWALDSIGQHEVVWLPREDQLRAALGDAFRRLERAGDRWRVVATIWGEPVEFTAADPEAAYGQALLHLLAAGPVIPGWPK